MVHCSGCKLLCVHAIATVLSVPPRCADVVGALACRSIGSSKAG